MSSQRRVPLAAGTQKGGTVYAGDTEFPYGILIVVSIGVALGVFFGGLLLSVAVMYMRRSVRAHSRWTIQGLLTPPPPRKRIQSLSDCLFC